MKANSEKVLDMEHKIGGPAYRWGLAQLLTKSQAPSPATQSDEYIQQASKYLRMCSEGGRGAADRKYPMLAAACAMVENEHSFQSLKLSVLGSLPRAEVAGRLGVEQHVIDLAELLFFDIGGLGEASSWMNCHIFVPEAKFGSKEFAAKMKMAFHGGPVVTRALLHGHEKLPLEESKQLIDQELLLHAKLQAALEFDLDAQSAEQFLKVFLDYDLRRQKLQFEREKFHLEFALARKRRDSDEANQEGDSTKVASRDGQVSSMGEQFQLAGVHQVTAEQHVA